LGIALIGSLPPELHGRSVTIDLKRRLPGDKVEEVRVGHNEHLDVLARKAARWTTDNATRIAALEPAMPPGIYNREADNWKPLLAIADAAGGEWPQRARDAALKSHVAAGAGDASMVELLLGDIRGVFASKGKESTVADMFTKKVEVEISSADLGKALVAMEGRPWAELGKSRKPLTPHGLANRLKPLAIGPGNVGPEDARVRGYKLTQFEEAFARYLPPEGVSKCTGAQHAANTGTSDDFQVDSQDDGCAVGKSKKPNNDGLLGGCALGKGRSSENTHARGGRSDDLPYDGPVVEVPDFGPDALDEHGAPAAEQASGNGQAGPHAVTSLACAPTAVAQEAIRSRWAMAHASRCIGIARIRGSSAAWPMREYEREGPGHPETPRPTLTIYHPTC
jgi:hypothetical protein